MAELTRAGLEALAREGARGQFDVVADGTVVFSKQRLGRFPEPGESTRLVGPRPSAA